MFPRVLFLRRLVCSLVWPGALCSSPSLQEVSRRSFRFERPGSRCAPPPFGPLLSLRRVVIGLFSPAVWTLDRIILGL